MRHGETVLGGFESQKVRGLLAYLLFHRDRPLSREFLATLLWPEKTEDAARRNLRQALYNLKGVLPSVGEKAEDAVVADRDQVQLHVELDLWFDVEEFRTSRRTGLSSHRVDPHYLAEAAGLYRGDLLHAFSVKDSSEFEQWLITERERLREQAALVFKALVECYLARGEVRLGTRYAHRLASIDPLSEEAHRYLIQLYGYSGRRSRAKAQYEELRKLLRMELGIEPSQKTQAVLRSALEERQVDDLAQDDGEPVGPLLPLAGRRASYHQLERQWQKALSIGQHVSLVCGEPGVGKTRLVRSFLDSVSSRSGTTVLKGRCEGSIPRPYQPIALVLQNAFTSQTSGADFSLEMVPFPVLQEVARLLPDLASLLGKEPPPMTDSAARERLFNGIGRFLDLFVGAGPNVEGRALILFLDDLQLADEDSWDVLRFLASRPKKAPLWIVATCDAPSTPQLLGHLGLDAAPDDHLVKLQRLDELAMEEVATALVGEADAAALLPFLSQRSGGLPMAVTSWVNFLWDEGALQTVQGEWRLTQPIHSLPAPDDSSLDWLVQQRLRRLPSSTRRVATLASIFGQPFTGDLLQRSEDEHMTVIELCLKILRERWLVQPHLPSWLTPRDTTDGVLGHHETATDIFEFAHRRIQHAVYQAVSPSRRRFLHRQIADVIARDGGPLEHHAEELAFHFSNAGAWQEAFPLLRTAARKAVALLAADTATFYFEKADLAAIRAAEASSHPEHAAHWKTLREEVRKEYENFQRSCGTTPSGP